MPQDPTHPNAYALPGWGGAREGNPVLRDVLESFPLPGNFHFRFRVDPPAGLANLGPLWADTVGGGSKVPLFRGNIVALAIGIKHTNASKQRAQRRRQESEKQQREGASQVAFRARACTHTTARTRPRARTHARTCTRTSPCRRV